MNKNNMSGGLANYNMNQPQVQQQDEQVIKQQQFDDTLNLLAQGHDPQKVKEALLPAPVREEMYNITSELNMLQKQNGMQANVDLGYVSKLQARLSELSNLPEVKDVDNMVNIADLTVKAKNQQVQASQEDMNKWKWANGGKK